MEDTFGRRVLERLGPGSLNWEDDVHYASFVMSDGDNVQWVMGNFVVGGQAGSYYANPRRGEVPLGGTRPLADLAQLAPYCLEELAARATPRDDFILFGGGYYYPDWFGSARRDGGGGLHPCARC